MFSLNETNCYKRLFNCTTQRGHSKKFRFQEIMARSHSALRSVTSRGDRRAAVSGVARSAATSAVSRAQLLNALVAADRAVSRVKRRSAAEYWIITVSRCCRRVWPLLTALRRAQCEQNPHL
jgi:hypothetical protein